MEQLINHTYEAVPAKKNITRNSGASQEKLSKQKYEEEGTEELKIDLDSFNDQITEKILEA